MSYKIRNSIVLGALLLLVIGIGVYITMFHLPRKIMVFETETKKIQGQLSDNTVQINAIAAMETTLRETVLRWENRTKEFAGSDAASETYSYLSEAMDESGSKNLKVNVDFVETKAVSPKISYNMYKIQGNSEFQNIFRFIWIIENGRRLYKVQNVVLKSEERADPELGGVRMAFEFDLQSFFTNEKELSKPVVWPDSTPQPIASNPFSPLISARIPENIRNLVDPGKLLVKALSQTRAMVQTEDGRLITLKVGSEVYLGKVTGINVQDGSITFSLNRGGITEVMKKSIVFEKQRRGISQ